MRLLAQIISYVFHPLLMCTYLFGMLFAFFPLIFQPSRPSPALLGIIALMTFLLPAINFLFFRLSGSIRDLNLPHRADRLLPFTLVAILYSLTTFMFHWKLPLPNVVQLLLIVSALVILGAIATFFYKVSVHCMGIWGVVGILLSLAKAEGGSALLAPIALTLIVAGLVMSARLYLNAHTPREVLAGSLMGITIGFAGMIILF